MAQDDQVRRATVTPALPRAMLGWLPALALMALIFFLSSQPDIPGPTEPVLDRLLKKSAHAIG